MRSPVNSKYEAGMNRFRGICLSEVIITSVISLIIALAVGTLVVGGNRAWHNSYDSANSQIETDSMTIMTIFGGIGRKSNRMSYRLYNLHNGRLTAAEPKLAGSEEVVSGDAVEFRYWDVELDKTDSHGVMDSEKLATAYALFYVDGGKLKLDYGPYPPGAIPNSSKSAQRNTSGVTTRVLAEDVSSVSNSGAGVFSHTTINGVGQGCVRINLVLKDPDTERETRITTATLLRNMWPK